MTGFSLVIPGKPKGKDRPRFARGRAYTPKETKEAEAYIGHLWEESGCPRHWDGPIQIDVDIFHKRPKSHFTTKGLLSAEGKKHILPDNQKPDIDNVIKLVMDALNKKAWRDDVQVVRASVNRWWAHAFESECTVIRVSPGSPRWVREPELLPAQSQI